MDLHHETIQLVTTTQGLPDADGIPTTVETPGNPYGGYNVQPVGTTESLGGLNVITGRWRVSGPLLTAAKAGDSILWRGTTYPIEGEPQHYMSGALDHTELIIKRQEG
ncbi:hypothetical protein JTF08_13710 [Micrococcaceae bacterium RIT802]|nr:hypothetical protein [Micrococcaceae bacterium RIT 802]